jgi:hypothetical protein
MISIKLLTAFSGLAFLIGVCRTAVLGHHGHDKARGSKDGETHDGWFDYNVFLIESNKCHPFNNEANDWRERIN